MSYNQFSHCEAIAEDSVITKVTMPRRSLRLAGVIGGGNAPPIYKKRNLRQFFDFYVAPAEFYDGFVGGDRVDLEGYDAVAFAEGFVGEVGYGVAV